jgi:thiamine biosynthesis protein ThiS
MRINGKVEDIAPATLASLLAARGIDPALRYLAVAVNGSVVPRRHWPSLILAASDDVEIVRPREGG